jgi:hypothetical protein
MQQKSFVEGARAFAYWGAMLIDQSNLAGDEPAHGLVSLLTPVIKGFLTDRGFEFCVQAQQIFGGHGYIEEWGMSQFARDARIAMIYEGANGVQALDLVGRKLGQDGGKHALAFFELIKTFCAESASESPEFKADFLEPLKTASKQLQEAALYFMQNGLKSPNTALAGSYDFMHLFGHVCLGYVWARMAQQAFRNSAQGTGDAAFNETKIKTGRYYMQRELPATALHLARIKSGADPVMALTADQF